MSKSPLKFLNRMPRCMVIRRVSFPLRFTAKRIKKISMQMKQNHGQDKRKENGSLIKIGKKKVYSTSEFVR
jgi:hypothetical protein